jgi:hypothetical protein
MQKRGIEKLVAERAKLMAELSELRLLLHGTWVERRSTCSRPDCRCHKAKPQRHGPRYYVVIVDGGKQRQKYVPRSQQQTARLGVAQHQRLLAISRRVTRINLALMRLELLAAD